MLMVSSTKAQIHVNMTINQEAPVVQSKEIIINAAPEKVWNVLTNIKAWGSWNTKINDIILNEELNAGAVFSWKINGSKIKSKIHTFKQNQVLGWTGKTFGATAIHNWYLEPTESGTKVMVEESLDGWILHLIKKKMNKQLADDMQYWLEQLKIESEN